MLTMMLVSLLTGAVIGLRFRVYVLLAAIGVALIVGGSGLLHPYALADILGEMTGTIFALQVGYLLGVLGRLPLCTFMNGRGRRSANLGKTAHSLLDS